jgi:hypothetical protein
MFEFRLSETNKICFRKNSAIFHWLIVKKECYTDMVVIINYGVIVLPCSTYCKSVQIAHARVTRFPKLPLVVAKCKTAILKEHVILAW